MMGPRNPARAWEVAVIVSCIALVAFGFALADLAEQVLR
jgi:hypothetical protein